jgi:glutamyl-tRNA synthetase
MTTSAPPNPPLQAPVRTRFAPSPTGYLHVGGARTALYCWAFARHHGGQFILRVEDTDLERSTPEAVQAILDGMAWLGLNPDEGPFYQMERMDRYSQVIAQMLAEGSAYHCYATPTELDAMREDQRARGLKPRYDGRWRPENAQRKNLQPPAGVAPVVRFRNPDEGVVSWTDGVKGQISISNTELDDLIIARGDGTPTYNFCVVVDDLDMRISHVIRGDDHINNTPRQINIMKALKAPVPVYAHLPMIHGPDGEKLSKRHGAVSVMQYHEDGYLPQALLNYLARLGWSHGDDEIFSLEQLQTWFTLENCSKSAAQFDFEKLKWLNNHYIRQESGGDLANAIAPRVKEEGFSLLGGPPLASVCELLKERASTLNELAEEVVMFYSEPPAVSDQLTEKMLPGVAQAIEKFAASLPQTWDAASLSAALKTTLAEAGLKMPQLAMPLRLILMGRLETPSIDKVMALLGRDCVARRIQASLVHYR